MGAANKYEHYKTSTSIISWIKQTDDDVKKGVASTYDLVKRNPLTSSVKTDARNAYATCVK